jgi:uncharacterized metal-binding protein YceD (DUF177 family)
VKSKRDYIIPFVGLKVGFHEFEFEIRDAFFDELEYSIIQKGNALVKLRLEKKETMLIGEFSVRGMVFTSCDRCNDPVEVPVDGTFRLIYKFGDEVSDDETLIVLPNDSYELDVRQNIYELITVSLPTRLVHPKGECNEEMLDLLQKYSGRSEDLGEEDDEDEWDDEDEDWDDEDDEDDDDPIDPRWSALKNLN